MGAVVKRFAAPVVVRLVGGDGGKEKILGRTRVVPNHKNDVALCVAAAREFRDVKSAHPVEGYVLGYWIDPLAFPHPGIRIGRRYRLFRAVELDGVGHASSAAAAVPSQSKYLDTVGRIHGIHEEIDRAASVHARERRVAFDLSRFGRTCELPVGS